MRISKHPAAQPYLGVVEKTASLFGPGDLQRAKTLGKNLLEFSAAAVPLAVLTAQGIAAAAAKLTEASRKATAYKTMLSENPHLHDHDAVTVQRYFNTLYRLNPELATDPTVAASFVGNQASLNNPRQPHMGIFEQARQLAALKRPEKSGGPGLALQVGSALGGLDKSMKNRP